MQSWLSFQESVSASVLLDILYTPNVPVIPKEL
jgi:hypothetical protein